MERGGLSGPGRRVAAVVIGRNEGARLRACLASLKGQAARVVYVDSGSTDGSTETAREAGAEVVDLDLSTPFTAARARNAGLATLEGFEGPYVQFVDGDCEIDPKWIGTAVAFLDADSGAAVACGRRRERHPETSVYNRLCDFEWNTPVGPAAACGGDSLMRLEAARAVGGFDPTLIAGEEPELCFRLRAAGWSIHRLDAEMTLHDAQMTRFSQWWRRAVRTGWAFAEGAARMGGSPERYNMRETRRIWIWGGVVPLAGLLGAATLALTGGVPWPAPVLLTAALYPAMAARIALRKRREGAAWGDALAYGFFTMLGKFAEIQGALRYLRTRRRGETARIIEYKTG